MIVRLKTLAAASALAWIVAGAAAQELHAQTGSVSAARELYTSAAYDESLRMLDALQASGPSREDRQTIGLYRILCLVAIGRGAEAEQALETLVTQEPLYRPVLDDLSPRIRATFTDARKRLLPMIIQQQYRDAKAAYERQEFAAAASAFALVLEELADPGIADIAAQPPLADLRTLATGFQDLSVKAAAPPPPPPATPAPIVIAAAPPVPVRDFRRVYTAVDADVTLPTPVKQSLPPFAGRLPSATKGVIDVLIDAMGAVEKATLREPIDPRYDAQLLSAAQRWQYKPATVEGVPVKFLKSVQVNLTGR
jgi:hypothetical protein